MKEQNTIFEATTEVKTTEVKKPTKKKKEQKKEGVFTFPFGFQFGPNPLTSDYLQKSLEFVVGEEYTIDQVKERLSIAVLELQAPDSSVHYIEEKNVFVLTNVLKSKGAFVIPLEIIKNTEDLFVETYKCFKTEERNLIYAGKNKIFGEIPKSCLTRESVESENIELFLNDDLDFPLVADLHSHHLLPCEWSKIDDENEKVRGVIFGICSWDDSYQFKWRFRIWDGTQYIELGVDDVVK